MPNISFHPGYGSVLLIALAAGSFVVVGVLYRRAFRSLPLGQFAWLYGLRMAAIGLVLLLLFQPVLSFQRQITERRSIVFLLDASKSMTIADDVSGGSRLDLCRAKVADWTRQLSDDFQIHLFAFSEAAHELQPEQLATLQAEGTGTSLAQALQVARGVARPDQTEAIFLVSDGIHNARGNPIKVATQLGIPVHAVGVGSALRDRGSYRDIRLTDLDVPAQLAVQNKTRIQASVDASGFPGRVATVSLSEDDRPLTEQTVTLDDTPGAQVVTFEFLPQTKGLHTYSARVQAPPDEKIVENNQRSRGALVVDARIRVLYLEGTLRTEYGAIVGRFLSKDPNVEFCALVQTRPNVFMQRTNMSDLSLTNIPDQAEQFERFDVFMLGDLDRTFFRDAQLELLRARVRNGAGLIMLGGYHSLGPGGYSGTPLDDVLPVVAGGRDVGQVGDPFLPVLTLDGRQHSIFANIQPFFPSEKRAADVDGLPPLEGCVRVAGIHPGATVLAVHPSETVAGAPLPILAVQAVGKGRAAVFTADTTRNWQQALRTMDRESPFLRFWGQMVRWLASRTDPLSAEAGIVATIDNTYFEPDHPVTISAVVRGREGEAAERATVTAAVTLPGGATEPLTLAASGGPAGNFRAVYDPVSFGRYEVVVEATVGGLKLQSEKLVFDVGRPSLEFDRLDLDDKTLSEISRLTSGQYAHLSTADRLIQRLERRLERRRVQYEVRLAWPPLIWLLFAASLTIEWLLRRSYSLR